MTKQQQISQWIAHPEMLNKDSLYELRKILATYPFFQTARILYLKNLYLMNAPEFKEELKKGALYVADLSVLFYYIEGEKFAIQKHLQKEEGNDVSASDRTLALINEFLSGVSDEKTEHNLIPEISADYTSVLLDDEEQGAQVPPLRGQELIDSFIEQHPVSPREEFSDETAPSGQLQDTRLQMDEDESVQKIGNADESEKDMSTSPVGQAETQEKKEEEKDDLTDEVQEVASEDNLEDSSLSETLAKIYVKQRRYDKALEIIKKLNLKYPKKNAYFADQIRFLEKLIINTKSK